MEEKVIEIKNCKFCSASFDITDIDIEFYDKVSPVFAGVKYSIPTPTLCPNCRQHRRLSFRNERNLYRRNCDLTGKSILSIYSPDKASKVYETSEWWSDKWNPFDYSPADGIDFSRNFFPQIEKLIMEVPVPSRTIDLPASFNSEYCNEAGYTKNCYLSFEIGTSENCNYCRGITGGENCLDLLNSNDCKDSYYLIESQNCSSSKFLLDCEGVSFSSFCFLCKNSSNCFLSSHIINKQYVFKNTEYSKEEYLSKINDYLEKNNFTSLFEEFLDLIGKGAVKFGHILNCNNVSGDYVINSQNATDCFSCADCKDCKYCDGLLGGSPNLNSYDVSNFGKGVQYCYESQCIGGNPGVSYHVIFSNSCWPSTDLIYCNFCISCNNCFGCSGLTNKSYCVFNKQYTKEEYETLVPKIIEHMKKTGEWGEFFPSSISPFGYNETVAMEYFPMDPVGNGLKPFPTDRFKWSTYENPAPIVSKTIPASKLPDNIKDIPDDILNWAIVCEVTNKPFRIIKPELEFYRKHNLPIPKRHPDQRHLDRMKLRNPRKLFDRECYKCSSSIKTTYSLERKESVLCEGCYLKEIY